MSPRLTGMVDVHAFGRKSNPPETATETSTFRLGLDILSGMVRITHCPNGHEWDADELTSSAASTCPFCGVREGTGQSTDGHALATMLPAEGLSQVLPDGLPLAFGPYRVLAELGRGSMGVVYLVQEGDHRRQVALKTLLQISPATLQRFKHEFRSLAGVTHPNLVQLLELVSDGRTWYFTMQFVDGVEFLAYTRFGLSPDLGRADGTIDYRPGDVDRLDDERLTRIRSAFRQLAAGLSCLHDHGVLHRDVKPSNVRVARDGRVVLLDFGLAAGLDRSGVHESTHLGILGTAAYMSPEQAASQPVSEASDWYAFGVMLFQALTGRLPFYGSPVQVLLDKQNKTAPAPSELQPDVPCDLDALCVQLLSKSWSVRPTGANVLRVLSDGGEMAVPADPTSREMERSMLVGRDDSLADLHAAFVEMEQGRPVSVLIRGRSGMGKSSLVDALLESLPASRAVVLTGRCYEQESVPFKALDSLIDSLARFLNSRRLTAADVEGLMPRDVAVLARLFPVLGRIKAVAAAPRRTVEVPDQQELKRRAIGALRELLGRLGDRWPLVVYIDDLQWGDEDSAAMLADLLQPPDAPVMLFLGTYRAEDADRSPFLRALHEIRRQRGTPFELRERVVEPLTPAESVALALALLRTDDSVTHVRAEAIAHESGGNPFYIAELARFAAGSDSRTEPAADQHLLDDMLWRRVQALPDEALRLLGTVAVAGQPLPIDDILQAADATANGPSLLGRLRAEHLVRTVGVGHTAMIESYHDRVRESVAKNLPPELKRHLHQRLAELLESHSGLTPQTLTSRSDLSTQRVYDLAFHFDAAGDSSRALSYSLFAAEQARAQYALEIAERQYRIAERHLATSASDIVYRVHEGLGDVLMLRGRYPESASQFVTARPLCPDNRTRAYIEGKLGEVAFKQGELRAARELTESALQLLGRKVQRAYPIVLANLAWEFGVQILHTYFPNIFVHRRASDFELAEDDLTAVRLYYRLVYAYWFTDCKPRVLWAHLRQLNLAERYPQTAELAHAYSMHAPVMGLIGHFSRGVHYAQKAIDIHQMRGNRQGVGQAMHFRGIVLYAAAKCQDCIATCDQAIPLLEQTGDYWEVTAARYHRACSLYRLGRLSDAMHEAQRTHQLCCDLGDAKSAAMCLDMWALGSGGKVPLSTIRSAQSQDRIDVQANGQALQAEAICLLAADRVDEAIAVLIRSRELVHKAGAKSYYVCMTDAWLATAFRRDALKVSANFRSRLVQAESILRQFERFFRRFRNDLPHVYRERAVVAGLRGQFGVAARYFGKALATAQQLNARYEEGLTLLARSGVGRRLGWSDAESDRANSYRIFDELNLSDDVRAFAKLITKLD